MNRLTGWTTVLVVAAGAAVAAAFADDLIVPPWRGNDGTTYQEWRFDTNENPAFPEDVENPYGNPSAEITVGDFGEGWFHELPGLGSKTGFWDIGGSGGSIAAGIPVGADLVQAIITSDSDRGSVIDQVVVDTACPEALLIGPSSPEPRQIPYAEVWVQVTYFVDITQPPGVEVPDGEYLGGETIIVEEVQTGGVWELNQSMWRVRLRKPPPQVPDDPPWGGN